MDLSENDLLFLPPAISQLVNLTSLNLGKNSEWRKGGKKGGKEWREGGRERGREGKREERRERGSEGGKEGGKERRREEGNLGMEGRRELYYSHM